MFKLILLLFLDVLYISIFTLIFSECAKLPKLKDEKNDKTSNVKNEPITNNIDKEKNFDEKGKKNSLGKVYQKIKGFDHIKKIKSSTHIHLRNKFSSGSDKKKENGEKEENKPELKASLRQGGKDLKQNSKKVFKKVQKVVAVSEPEKKNYSVKKYVTIINDPLFKKKGANGKNISASQLLEVKTATKVSSVRGEKNIETKSKIKKRKNKTIEEDDEKKLSSINNDFEEDNTPYERLDQIQEIN